MTGNYPDDDVGSTYFFKLTNKAIVVYYQYKKISRSPSQADEKYLWHRLTKKIFNRNYAIDFFINTI